MQTSQAKRTTISTAFSFNLQYIKFFTHCCHHIAFLTANNHFNPWAAMFSENNTIYIHPFWGEVAALVPNRLGILQANIRLWLICCFGVFSACVFFFDFSFEIKCFQDLFSISIVAFLLDLNFQVHGKIICEPIDIKLNPTQSINTRNYMSKTIHRITFT